MTTKKSSHPGVCPLVDLATRRRITDTDDKASSDIKDARSCAPVWLSTPPPIWRWVALATIRRLRKWRRCHWTAHSETSMSARVGGRRYFHHSSWATSDKRIYTGSVRHGDTGPPCHLPVAWNDIRHRRRLFRRRSMEVIHANPWPTLRLRSGVEAPRRKDHFPPKVTEH